MSIAQELLETLKSIRGIEAFIDDPECRALFQSKVYPMIEKAEKSDLSAPPDKEFFDLRKLGEGGNYLTP